MFQSVYLEITCFGIVASLRPPPRRLCVIYHKEVTSHNWFQLHCMYSPLTMSFPFEFLPITVQNFTLTILWHRRSGMCVCVGGGGIVLVCHFFTNVKTLTSGPYNFWAKEIWDLTCQLSPIFVGEKVFTQNVYQSE